MHVEVPEHPAQSFKAFGLQYLMIVLSILTALGLEELVTSVRHKRAGEVAQQEIEAELRENLKEVRSCLRSNAEDSKKLQTLSAEYIRELKAGTPTVTLQEHLGSQARDVTLKGGILIPTLRREAWEVAVGNQSATYIAKPALRTYAAAYARQRDLSVGGSSNISIALNGSHLSDVVTDLDVGNAAPVEVLHVMRQLVMAIASLNSNLRDLEKTLSATLSVPSDAPPPEAVPLIDSTAAAR